MATKLSNELLDAIFIDLSKADLLNLVKTHRVFYASAQRYLFHTVAIPTQSTIITKCQNVDPRAYLMSGMEQFRRQVPVPGSRDVSSLSAILLPSQLPQEIDDSVAVRQHTAALLLQALPTKSSLAILIRNVHLDCQWDTSLFVNTQVYGILTRVGTVEQLTVAIQDQLSGPHWHMMQQVCSTQLFDTIKDVKITKFTLASPNLKALSKLLAHPHAETIQVDTIRTWHEEPGFDIGEWNYADGDWLPSLSSQNLKCIDLGKFLAQPRTIERILAQATTLRSFSTTIRWLFPITPLLPASADNLQELALLEASGAHLIRGSSPSADADFTTLKQLKNFTITSSLWFDWSVGNNPSGIDSGFAWRNSDR